jgi:hypothetical protein
VPVGVTARFGSRGCARVVLARKCVPLLLHPLRCVTMLAQQPSQSIAPHRLPRADAGEQEGKVAKTAIVEELRLWLLHYGSPPTDR